MKTKNELTRMKTNELTRMKTKNELTRMKTNELKPTVWRTARALANADRLTLLRLVYRAQGSLGVTALAEEAGLAVPTASLYLRALNARGLVSVVRSGSNVFYGTSGDRSLPDASDIQSAFFRLFARENLPQGWPKPVLALLRGYSHPRRVTIIRCLKERPALSFTEIQRACAIPPVALLRHLAVLVSGGIVTKGEGKRYSLSAPANDIAASLLAAVR